MASTKSGGAGGCLVVYTSCAPGRDDEFNKWYDEIHAPEICALGPFTEARRYRIPDTQMLEQKHAYLAIYEYEGSAEDARKALEESAGKLRMTETFDPAEAFMTITERI